MDYQDNNSNALFTYMGPMATRMACHMGDLRVGPASAICNILSDQPLFYIDYVDEEEADFINPDMLGDFMDFNEPMFVPVPESQNPQMSDLRRRISRLESACTHIDGYMKPDTTTAFDAAVEKMNKTPEKTDVKDIIAALKNSRFLTSLLEQVTDAGVKIKTSSQIDVSAYDREGKTIFVTPHLSAIEAAIALAAPLRQAWLHLIGAAIHPLHFAPEEAILLNRIQNADAACTTIRAAWELKLAGFDAPWARLITGSAYDLGQSFAREAIADFRALNTGAATAAAFEKWFFSGRCKEIDRKLIQSMLSDNHGLVFNHPQVSRSVTADVIARTGDQPEGKNYLTGLIEIILADPLFTEVRDRSNANFLWFIKFERSFRAHESTPEEQFNNTPAHRADIVAFPNRKSAKGSKTATSNAQDSGTVYYLDHFLSFSNR